MSSKTSRVRNIYLKFLVSALVSLYQIIFYLIQRAFLVIVYQQKKKINSQIFMRRLCYPKKSESSKIRQKIRTDFDNIFKKDKGKLVVVQAVVKGL